jgi:tetratricopeptide (TPR) repeat protein
VEAHAGLGEAEFAQGNYRAAQRDFQTALHLAPDDQAVRQNLDRCNELLTLDPTLRGLGAGERFRRSLKLVDLTQNAITQCVGRSPSPELRGLFDSAAQALKARVSASRQSEVSESNLDLAEQLLQAGKKECKSPPGVDSPLALVLARIAQ